MTQKEAEKQMQKIIFKHIDPTKYEVFLYGSRAFGNAKKWSDYDIGIMGKEKIPYSKLSDIEDELKESDIPYVVEVVDFNNVGEDFKKTALEHKIKWSK